MKGRVGLQSQHALYHHLLPLRRGILRLLTVSVWVVFLFGGLVETFAQELVASNTCAMCHSSDGQIMQVNGVDESPVGGWMASVMAFASQDPYWRAKMAAEVADRPALKEDIEAECLTCHAPVATAKAALAGQTYTRENLNGDPLGLDGVTCLSCHRISPEGLGTPSGISGRFKWETGDRVNGPYQDPLQRPMFMHTGFVPQFGAHIKSSELCAACHNLQTPIFDEQNQKVGEFPEQTIYSEWVVSDYKEAEQTCQQCHMPELRNDSRVSLMPPFAPERNQIWSHRIVGGNTFLLSMMKYKRDAFGISASEFDFEKTLALTRSFLKTSLEIEMEAEVQADSVRVRVKLTNLAGHKFPTGYPERRAWLHLRVEDHQGNVVFESGAVDSVGKIRNGEGVLPHFDVITSEEQVQIYEMIPADREGLRTRRLLSAASKIKDNRLLPMGFRPLGSEYAGDVEVVGQAAKDANFDGEDGTDQVTYLFPVAAGGDLNVTCRVLYQAVPPGAIDDLRSYGDDDVRHFLNIVNDADLPVLELVASASILVQGDP